MPRDTSRAVVAPGSGDATRAAERILDAFGSLRLIPPLSRDDPSLDEDGAYAIAREVHARRVRRGETPVGRKIGFTNRSIWAEYRVSAPIWGHVYDSTVHYARDDSRLAVGHLLQPRIETEIQLHFRRTPPITRDEHAILESIDWIAQGFEIVQCPFPDWDFAAVDTIAAYAVHGALVIGAPVPVSEIENCADKLRRFEVVLSKDGVQQARGVGANVLGSPLLAFAHLAEVLSMQSRFPRVQAGEIVSTGTLTGLMPVAAGEEWSTTISGIELPGVSISIA
jgi:2-oxo-3-hexenedioate decarboxylase